MIKYLEFEKDIEKIDTKISLLNLDETPDKKKIIKNLDIEKQKLFNKIYSNLNSWQKVQIARHPNRPHTFDYIKNIFSNFVSLAGDKKFGEDEAIISGLGKIDSQSVMIIGTEKGSSMETRIKHNFGMAKPEGYRKSQRLMYLAEKLGLPIITFIDTAGAFPGKDAEERGQSESIASSIATCLKVKTPILSIIIGEGGSGGAVAIATANRVTMLEHSIYTVASPEASASILWRDSSKASEAANSMRITAQDLIEMKIIDGIVSEPIGGAHRNHQKIIKDVEKTIIKNLSELTKLDRNILVDNRRNKFLSMGRNI